ncbi:RIMS-binding protein 2 isoform X3 [Argonauta hians]
MEYQRRILLPIRELKEDEEEEEEKGGRGEENDEDLSQLDTADDVSEIEDYPPSWKSISRVDPSEELYIWGDLMSESSASSSLENKRYVEEREKPLHKKVGELQTQVLKLERKTMILKNENDSLKRKQEDYQSREEKLKSFRKRNAELAAVAKRLEDKAKILQQQNLKRSEVHNDRDNARRYFEKQRNQEHAEYSKNLSAKEKEIEELKRQYKILEDKIASMSKQLPQNARLYEDQEELETIIKQAAKERLHLEKQLVRSKQSTQESELLDTTLKNCQLEENVERLEQKLQESESVSEECAALKQSLRHQEQECEMAKEKIASLEAKISFLQQIIKELQKSDDQLKVLDTEHRQTLQTLSQKDEEIQILDKAKADLELRHNDTIKTLKSQLGELEHKYRMQELKQEELNLELTILRDQRPAAHAPPPTEPTIVSQQSVLVESQHQSTPNNTMNKPPGRLLADSRLPAMVGSGQVQVYIAKYNYDPFQFSPNENPETELALNSGDYVFISGEMDEDGFFEGELINGSKGLVPSNFVEKVPVIFPEDKVVATGGATVVTSAEPSNDLGHITQPEDEPVAAAAAVPPNSKLLPLSQYSNFDKETETIFPHKLNLDRQLTNSVLISWLAPEVEPNVEVIGYQVFVDNKFKVAVKRHERTKALLEDIDSKKTCRVCVLCLSTLGRSAPQHCTMLIGKDVIPAPSDLKVSHISSNGAVLSWLPGNTNYQHVICVNGAEVRVVNPGVYEYILTGLAPASSHSISVRAKSLLSNFEEESSDERKGLLTDRIEFKTLAGGLPDPPLDVQVEVGPQEGTVLLTWLPVTINASGISPSGIVKGYSVYADGKKLKDVQGPINDHVLLTSSDFCGRLPDRLTVRTLADTSEESVDSQCVLLPPNLLKEMAVKTAKNIAYEAVKVRKCTNSTAPFGGEKHDEYTNDTDEEIEAAFRLCSDLDVGLITKKVPPDRSAFHSPIRRPSSKLSERRTSQHSMTIPAIEITRDSSTERGNSFEDEEESSLQKRKSIEDKTKGLSRKKVDEVDGLYNNNTVNSTTTPTTNNIIINSSNNTNHSTNIMNHSNNTTTATTITNSSNSILNQKDPTIEKGVGGTSQRWRTEITPDHMRSPNSGKGRPRSSRDCDIYYDDEEEDEVVVVEKGGISSSGGGGGNVRRGVDCTMRLFVALFDYDPAVMSPNADGSDAELPFHEGDFIKIFGDCGADGFYRGEANGKLGYVPGNMVTEVKVRERDWVQQLLKDNTSTSSGDSSSTTTAKENFVSPKSMYRNADLSNSGLGPGKLMVALYDYDPRELSPNVDAEVELAFKVGDFLTIYGDMDDDGFFIGEMKGQKGLVPSNFIREATMSTEELRRDIEGRTTSDGRRKSRMSLKIDTDINRAPGMGSKSLSECKLDGGVRPASAPHSDDDHRKGKRKGGLSSAHSMSSMGAGLLSKGKNIFKKFTR